MTCSRRNFLMSAAGATLAGLLANETWAAPPPAPEARPNILLLFPDQWRFDWTSGRSDLPIETPNLDAIAARGVRFEQAVVPSPICAPSRACLASGLEYDKARTPSNGFNYPLAQTTVYSRLRESGYQVMTCGKLDLAKGAMWWGVDGKWRLDRLGFSDGLNNAGKWDQLNGLSMNDGAPPDPYTAFLKARGLLDEHVADYKSRQGKDWQATYPTPLPDDAYGDNWITDCALQLLAHPKDKPWFLQVNWMGPHEPEDITKAMELTVRGRSMPKVIGENDFDAAKNTAIRQNYTAMCENIDRQIGLLWKQIEAAGQADNTLVIFASDHGEMLGDHGRWGKSVPYQPSVRVPVMVAGPGVVAGRRSNALISLIDLTATIQDYAALAPTSIDGRSLRGVLEGKASQHRRVVYSGLGGWRMAWDGRYKVITGFAPQKDASNDQNLSRYAPEVASRPPMVFDTHTDPDELHDLAKAMPPQAKALLDGLISGGYPA